MKTFTSVVLLAFAFTLMCNARALEREFTTPNIAGYIYSRLEGENGTHAPTERRMDFGMAFHQYHMYLLGGVNVATGDYTTDIWAMNSETGAWNHTGLQLKSAKHCVAQNGSLVYIVGGEGNATSSFQTLNLDNGKWNNLPARPGDFNLFPACAIYGKHVVVFGGCRDNGVCSGKVDIFDTNSSQWKTLYSGESELEEAPSARGGATLNIIKVDTVDWGVVLGGQTGNLTSTNVYLFNMTNSTWTSLSAAGLPHLAYHTAVTTAANNIIVFGGESLTDDRVSGETYVLSINGTKGNVTHVTFTTSIPVARKSHAGVYSGNRMIIYGGNYKDGEGPANAWQLAVEVECLSFTTCGECLLAGCFWCNPNATDPDSPVCVAGSVTPYIADTCTHGGYNHSRILMCRKEHPAQAWLIAVTVVVLVVIAILVVATYIVDYKKGKASSGGYEPIGGGI